MKSYKMKGKVEEGVDPELQRQAEYIVNTVKDSQKTGEGLWHHGGAGSGYKSAEDARKDLLVLELLLHRKPEHLVQAM